MSFFNWIEHIIFGLVLATFIKVWMDHGVREMLRLIMKAIHHVPGVQGLFGLVFQNEAAKLVRQVQGESQKHSARSARVVIPKKGIPAEELRQELRELCEKEFDHNKGRLFGYTYTMKGDKYDLQTEFWELFQDKVAVSQEHDQIAKEFQRAFLHENGLNPMIYPSLRRMETEIISMAASMLNGDEHVCGFLTSGGTESILMAIKTYRDRAEALFPYIRKPNIVAPITIHPAMEKAAHYFHVEMIHAPVDDGFRVNVAEMEKLINSNTIMLACSAPQFPHGVVDPVEQVSALALKKGLPLHIDACFGGFMLPWVEKLGYPVPKFDFRNPGVTSISADGHKWGYCVKGSSVVLYRNNDYRRYQVYSYTEWCGGLYGSPTMAGSRPAGNIASTWATMKHLGEDGYMKMSKQLMETSHKMMDGIAQIPGLYILGKPHMNAFAVASNDSSLNIQAVADFMEEEGFKMERQLNPSCVHLSILPCHIKTGEDCITAFQDACAQVKAKKALPKEGVAAMYGMMATIPDKSVLEDFVVEFFCQIYK